MPEKEVILRKTASLPIVETPIKTGRMYSHGKIWEENEAKAHFKITKEKVFSQLPPVYSLSVSGDKQDSEKVIADFTAAFGSPLIRDTSPDLPRITFVLWNADEVDKNRSK